MGSGRDCRGTDRSVLCPKGPRLLVFRAELIRKQGPWSDVDAVEYATLGWVDWYNNKRLFGKLGHIPPVECEAAHHQRRGPDMVSGLN